MDAKKSSSTLIHLSKIRCMSWRELIAINPTADVPPARPAEMSAPGSVISGLVFLDQRGDISPDGLWKSRPCSGHRSQAKVISVVFRPSYVGFCVDFLRIPSFSREIWSSSSPTGPIYPRSLPTRSPPPTPYTHTTDSASAALAHCFFLVDSQFTGTAPNG